MPLARALMRDGHLESDVVLFDVQLARDLVDDRAVSAVLECPVRLPFPAVFMEFDEPSTQNGEIFGPRVGFLVLDDDDGFVRFVNYVTVNGNAKVVPIGLTIKLRDDGVVDRDSGMNVEDIGVDAETDPRPDEELQRIAGTVSQLMFTPLIALSLLNCRNVRSEPLGTIKMRRSGREKRQGLRPFEVRYNTIILPGGGSQRVGEGASAHHRATSLHRVRGHTKTFTAERPLMGKHVGTYWWGWQLRGSPELGIVDSSYRMTE